MIIFDLDGTLADCEHRRHFVDPSKIPLLMIGEEYNPEDLWKPDWKAFYEACDKDTPIDPVIQLFKELYLSHAHTEIQIWSGRCESVRKKTLMWLDYNINPNFNFFDILKMRPIGDNTPDDQLKERWLNERCKHVSYNKDIKKTSRDEHDIDFVFDDRPKVIRMWRRRGIFVFNCCQHDREF